MQFKKILSYDVYGTEPNDRFTRVCSLLTQTIDPPSLEPNQLDTQGKTVFTSPRLRARAAIKLETAQKIIIEPALNEIPFDILQFCTAKDFFERGSTVVREAFLHLFATNKLLIAHEVLESELELILLLSSQNQSALAVSHTFRLRLLQAYVKTDKKLFANPKQIYEYLNPTEHWLGFGSDINIQNSFDLS